MKAAVLYGNEDLRYDDFKTPEVTPEGVKIKVMASGICGSDIPRVFFNGAHNYPVVLGHEFAGEVVETGKNVTAVKIGDRVTVAPRIPCLKCQDCIAGNIAQCKNDSFIGSRVQGSFAEYIVVPEKNAVVFDESVSYEVASFFEPATVALHGVQNVDYKAGEYVAVIGAGTIGNLTMQWTKIFGSRKTVVFDIDDKRLDLAKKLGADAVINITDKDFLAQAMDLTQNKGFHYVFEVVGINSTLINALKLAGAKAHISLIGTPPGSVSFTKEEWEIFNRKELYVRGCWQGYSTPFPGKEWELTAHYFSNKQLVITKDFIHATFPLSQAAQAFELFKTPGKVHGKVLILGEL